MANKLTVQEQEAITNRVRLGWGIRKIARELGVSRNTVRAYARSVEVLSAQALAEEILQGSPPSSTIETDPLSTPGSAAAQNQTDPLSTAGNTGRKSLCADHAAFILAKCEAGLSAQRIYQDQREIRAQRRNVGALKLSNLLQPDRFEEDLQISRVRLRAPSPRPSPPPSAPALSARDQQRGRQRALECLRQIKTALR